MLIMPMKIFCSMYDPPFEIDFRLAKSNRLGRKIRSFLKFQYRLAAVILVTAPAPNDVKDLTIRDLKTLAGNFVKEESRSSVVTIQNSVDGSSSDLSSPSGS